MGYNDMQKMAKWTVRMMAIQTVLLAVSVLFLLGIGAILLHH
jgi:hypothetical protein